MVRTYTPEERAERRRRSSQKREIKPLIDDEEDDDEESEASWIADLRAQGVDVAEFLSEALPEVIGIPAEVNIQEDKERINLDVSDDRRGNNIINNNRTPSSRSLGSKGSSSRSLRGSLTKQLSRTQRLSIISKFSDQPGVDESAKKRFSDLLDKSYNYDGKDIVKKALANLSEQQWQREVERDAKNYDPSSTTEEKRQQNREWALKMCLKRTTAAGYHKSAPKDILTEEHDTNKMISTKIDPPKTTPLPPITDDDFKDIPVQPLNPKELGIFPPSYPHKLIDIVPTKNRNTRIVDGLCIHGSYEERLDSIDSDTMVVACTNLTCGSYLYCSRGASLVRCDNCRTVCPGIPETVRGPPSKLDEEQEMDKSERSDSSDSSADCLKAEEARRQFSQATGDDTANYLTKSGRPCF